jgi:phage I-like protein
MARYAEFVGLASVEAGSSRSWIEVMTPMANARNGRWFFTITAEDLTTYAGSIESRPGRIPVDYDHPQQGQSSRAAGWLTGKTEVRDGNLWAEVEWTPKAVQEIRDGEFRFVSPEFTFEQKDPKTGLLTKAKQLVAATLTNRPFMSMSAVTATEGDSMIDEVAARVDAHNQFEYANDAGRRVTADDDEIDLHVRAEELLASRKLFAPGVPAGEGREYTADEYVVAYAAVAKAAA